MKNNRERINYFRNHSSPTPDHSHYKALIEYHEKRIQGNSKLKKLIEKASKEATSLRLTQSKNGIGLLQDTELRYFLDEYNSRIWDFGLGSTPSSINVLEGFFLWNADLFYFQLHEEEEHLFSFFDFLDFVTSNDCSNSVDYFTQNAQEDLIYSYNLLNEVTDLTFKTSDSKEYVVGGISLIKRGNEAFILMVAGELADVDQVTGDLEDYEPDQKRRWYIRPDKSRQKEAIGLMDRKDIWKVNIYARIDLESKSIDSRYVQKDEGNRFSTITDDVDMLRKSIPDEKLFTQAMEQNLAEIANYDAIFEIAYKSLHLPEYFDFNDQDIVYEEHPTGLFSEKATYSFRNKTPYASEHFHTTKDVWVLDKNQNILNK